MDATNRRRGANRGRPSSGAGGSQPSNMMKFFSEDSKGLSVGPVTVLVCSLVFMVVVVSLHILAKLWTAVV